MIAAIIKTINLASLSARADYPWDTVDLTIWIAVEQYLIILAACIPTLTPVFNIAVHRSKRTTARNQSRSLSGRQLASGKQEYPLAWSRAERVEGEGEGESESEDPMITTETRQGILMTTEIHVNRGTMDD